MVSGKRSQRRDRVDKLQKDKEKKKVSSALWHKDEGSPLGRREVWVDYVLTPWSSLAKIHLLSPIAKAPTWERIGSSEHGS